MTRLPDYGDMWSCLHLSSYNLFHVRDQHEAGLLHGVRPAHIWEDIHTPASVQVRELLSWPCLLVATS